MAAIPAELQANIDVLLLCAENGYQKRATARIYCERFPNRRPVNHRQVARILERFRRTGNVRKATPKGRPRTATNRQNEERVRDAVAANPHVSTRAIARQIPNTSAASVCRMLKRQKFHPYHVHLHQALHEGDFARRVEFCTWLDSCVDDDPAFLENILWSDEASFSRDGNVNLHNAHYWAQQNPHWLRETDHQERFRVNVWCGIYHDTLVGPVFLPAPLTGARYLQLLQQAVDTFVNDLPLAALRNLWFQQDGAPCHSSHEVQTYLDETFPHHWIGRFGPVAWPPRSPDLTPLDFFLWGVIKQRVYQTPPVHVADLQDRIQRACAEVTPELLQRVRGRLRQRIRTCIATDGRHFEHILDLN